MSKFVSRRDFLKLGGAAVGVLASTRLWRSVLAQNTSFSIGFSRQPEGELGKLVRVASKQIDVRSLPNDQAPITGNRFKDQILQVYEEVNPPDAPKFYNTLWYKVWGGYIHSAHLQTVDIHLNEPQNWASQAGQLCEVTVPFTTAYQYSRLTGWSPWRGSRLYYSSTHWVTAVEQGPDGGPWYRIVNELSDSEIYYAPAIHLRFIDPKEYAPISVDIPPEKKKIEVSLREQKLRAFENDEVVLETLISSGIPTRENHKDDYPTATPAGRYVIYSKNPSKHMGSVAGGDELEKSGGFTLPGVPWTSFFINPGGYALHGTYWHTNFGLQMSHGCVNMRNEDALFIFRWSNPVFDPYKIKSSANWEVTGYGTTIIVY